MKALLEEVVWGDEERTDDAERAWEHLGLHLGFVSTRPEKLYATGPDNLWALPAARQAAGIHTLGGPAPVRRFLPELIQLIWDRTQGLRPHPAAGAGPRGLQGDGRAPCHQVLLTL